MLRTVHCRAVELSSQSETLSAERCCIGLWGAVACIGHVGQVDNVLLCLVWCRMKTATIHSGRTRAVSAPEAEKRSVDWKTDDADVGITRRPHHGWFWTSESMPAGAFRSYNCYVRTSGSPSEAADGDREGKRRRL